MAVHIYIKNLEKIEREYCFWFFMFVFQFIRGWVPSGGYDGRPVQQ